jgi:hypothetical protein
MSDLSVVAMQDTILNHPEIFDKFTGPKARATILELFPYAHTDITVLEPDETYLFGGRLQMIFGTGGFLYTARVVVSQKMPMALRMVDCTNDRVWGTTKGAGQMAVERISSGDTQLDHTPNTWIWVGAFMQAMDVDQKKWAPHAKETVVE